MPTREQHEQIREAVRQAKEDARRTEQRTNKRERARPKKDDPLVLKIDKWFDRHLR